MVCIFELFVKMATVFETDHFDDGLIFLFLEGRLLFIWRESHEIFCSSRVTYWREL